MKLLEQIFQIPSLESSSSFDSIFEDEDLGDNNELLPKASNTEQSQNDAVKHINDPLTTDSSVVRKIPLPASSQPHLNVQVECYQNDSNCESDDKPGILNFNTYDMREALKNKKGLRPKEVVVAVEATAICDRDLAMRRTKTDGKSFVLGSNLVGVVYMCGSAAEDYGIFPGIRVAAIVKYGANAKFVTISAAKLVTIPRNLDPSDVACLLAVYLPAFQALHHGRARPYRYSRSILEKRKIFINGSSLQAQAMVRLARLAGAVEVFIAAPVELHEALEKCHAKVLDDEPESWATVVGNDIDIAIDLEFPISFQNVQETVGRGGRMVCSYPAIREKDTWLDKVASVVDFYHLFTMKRATLFNFNESALQYREGMREDLRYLLRLLAQRQIRPQIDCFIKLEDIPAAHMKMEEELLTGSIICEPWKE